MTEGSRAAIARLLVAASLCAVSIGLVIRQGIPRRMPLEWVSGWLWCVAVFAVALALVALGRAPARRVTAAIVLAGTIGCQAAAFVTPPPTSTDAYHYVWDGRVSVSGVSPYRYVPGDDALASLRDPVLFPGLGPEERSGITTIWPLPTGKELRNHWQNEKWTVLSRPGVPTIYPPVAQLYFAGLAAVTPWSAGTVGVQLAAAVLAVLITVLLLQLTRRLGIDARWVVLWGWSPTVAIEATANGHVDVLAAAFVLGACLSAAATRRRRELLTGALLGAAVAVKIFPIVLVPAFVSLRDRPGLRRALLLLAGFLGLLVVVYLPHVLTVGDKVIGYFGGYFADQGYADAGKGVRRFGVLVLLGVPQHLLYPTAAVVVVVTAALVFLKADPQRPWVAGLYLLGTAFLLATPSYPWYMLVLVPLIVLSRRPEWMLVPLAANAGYVAYPHLWVGPIVWTVATVVIVLVTVGRYLLGRAHADRSPAPTDGALAH